MLLFRHALLDVIHLPGDSDALVVTFNERGMVSNGEVLWGEQPLRRLGFAAAVEPHLEEWAKHIEGR